LHESDESDVKIDIFTSIAEVPFAGHPTIGTANWLYQIHKERAVTTLLTKAGRIGISYDANASGGNGRATLSLPQDFHVHQKKVDGRDGEFTLVSIVKGMSFVLVPLPSLDALKGEGAKTLVPNTYRAQNLLDDGWQVGLIGTYYYVVVEDGEKKVKVRTRMWGSREDPATGSAASALSCWLGLQKNGNELEVEITQGVEMGRQSEIGVMVRKTGDGMGIEEVLLSGTAVKVIEGSIEVE